MALLSFDALVSQRDFMNYPQAEDAAAISSAPSESGGGGSATPAPPASAPEGSETATKDFREGKM
jgi:hypothetical protein